MLSHSLWEKKNFKKLKVKLNPNMILMMIKMNKMNRKLIETKLASIEVLA